MQGLLITMADVPIGRDAEFLRWFGGDHTMAIEAAPEILSGRLYRAVEGSPSYLMVYELGQLSDLAQPGCRRALGDSPAARNLPFECANVMSAAYWNVTILPSPTAEELGEARGLMVRNLNWEAEHVDELQDWYDTEHIPALTGVPGALRGRRCQLSEAFAGAGAPPLRMAMFELTKTGVLKSEAWKVAADTPWTKRAQRFFCSPTMRNVYQRVYPV